MAKNSRDAYALGLGGPIAALYPTPIIATRVPATTDTGYEIGTTWINTSTNQAWILTSVSAGSATWAISSPGSSDVDTLTGDAGGAISPAGGNITLAGGTNITTTGAVNTITFNLDAAITLATSVTSPSYLSAAAMAVTSTGAMTITSGAAIDMNVAAGSNITFQMGDAAGANVIDFEDSASATVAALNSNGQFSAVNLDGIIGAVTPAAITGTTITANTQVLSPIYTTGAGVDLSVNAIAGQDIVLIMGDAAGANKVSFQSSAPAEVFSIDSTGALSTLAALTVTGLITANGSMSVSTAGTALNLGTDNSGDAVNIGNGNVARAISIGTTAATAHTVSIGNATAGAIAVDTAAGISLDAATASNFTVTGAADLTINSTAGGVDITSGEAASSTGITLTASAADGGMTFDAGSGGILIGVSADCTPVSICDVVPTSARTITVGGGAVATAIADTIDIGPDGATTNAGASKVVTINNGTVDTGTLTTNVAAGAITSGTHTVNIQSGNAAAGTVATNISTGTGTKTVSVGNTDANTTINLDGVLAINNNVNANVTINDGTSTGAVTIGAIANTGAISLASSSTIDLDAAGAISINSTGAALNIGNDANAFAINVGTGGAARTITVGNNTGATSVVVDVGTGAASFGATATDHTTTIGSTTGSSPTIIQSGTGEITVTGTVKQIDAELMGQSGIYVPTFTQDSVAATAANTGGVPTGATGDVNIYALQGGFVMQGFVVGAGQTILQPIMGANGLIISADQTNTEGMEYNFPYHQYTIGTSAAFFMEVDLYINDMDGSNPYIFGFRKTEANNATWNAYDTYATIGMIASTSTTNIVVATELNGAGTTITNSGTAWGGDGSVNTLQVLVSAAGVVTYSINGTPYAGPGFTIDNADVVIPYLRIEHSASATDVAIQGIRIGFQA